MSQVKSATTAPPVRVPPTTHAAAPPVEEQLDHFWELGAPLNDIAVEVAPAEKPLEILEKLGSSPFDRKEFPLIGFLATTYDKVSRFALDRRSSQT